ncbi:MAG: DNA methyltransferase [Methanocellales archaeon]|nr:DNA methyltransferase [Methanocellales archaeon]
MKRFKRRGTETSSFGVSARINHDSSKFYNSRLYEGVASKKQVRFVENKINQKFLNKVFCKSSEKMEELPDCSIHLMVTSPPYNVGKEYDENLSLDEYLQLLGDVFKETYRVLVPGGRVCINVANLGRKPYIPLHSHIIKIMCDLGFFMRGEVIWDKTGAGTSTAWGSWLSARNPILRDQHEYILIFSKDDFTRKNPEKRRSTISKKEFLEFTKSVWTFPPESAIKVGHPAPFPVELPYRCIQLYTFEGDAILDPFVGSGTTCIAAIRTNRNFVGYDIKKEYIEIANKRINKELNQAKITKFNNRGEIQKGSGEPATEKQKKFMKDLGIDFPEGVTKQEASRLIEVRVGN